MDIVARLQQIELIVQEAKSMPLSSSVLVNREELLELVQEGMAELPEEVKQATKGDKGPVQASYALAVYLFAPLAIIVPLTVSSAVGAHTIIGMPVYLAYSK